MRTILFLISFLCCKISLAQQYGPSELNPGDEKKLELIDLRSSSALFSFRFWNHGQAIDVQILSDSTKIGIVTNFLTEVSSETKLDSKVHVQKIKLSEEYVQKIFTIIEKYEIYNLPTDDSIKSWQPVLDGEWFTIEQNFNGKYSSKYYSNPRSQKNSVEATTFLNFYNALEDAINLKKLFSTFFISLNIECYSRNGEHLITCWKKN